MAVKNPTNYEERYEAAFNRIHQALKQTVKNAQSDKFTDLVFKGKTHAMIRYYEPDLCQFAKLRNAMVHEKIKEGYYIAVPHPEIVEKIEKIADELEKPQSALSIASKPVHFFYEDDSLSKVLEAVKEHHHSRFPIYNREDEYLWLLTSSEIVKWLADHFSDEKMAIGKAKVKELYDPAIQHDIVFASQNDSVLEIENLFDENSSPNKKLDAVIITKSGKAQEKPNGIITSSDLLEAEIND
ncbi:CBS domain-containing protein [Bacillus massiliglaciei]|uniref:CBS domain-containing protein n=1 Tax=Bacillus massiliglaciei TaxID=1816693 RepID=UPI000DA5F6F7|nr:CBS domain-containing protein [Bacillus massiliglaciei]